MDFSVCEENTLFMRKTRIWRICHNVSKTIRSWSRDQVLWLTDRRVKLSCLENDIWEKRSKSVVHNFHTQHCVTIIGCTRDGRLNMSMHAN